MNRYKSELTADPAWFPKVAERDFDPWDWRIPASSIDFARVKRKFHVTLLQHEEGVSVSCPELPGCHSQGATVEEALANIEDAIRGYIDLYGAPDTRCEVREMEVVTPCDAEAPRNQSSPRD